MIPNNINEIPWQNVQTDIKNEVPVFGARLKLFLRKYLFTENIKKKEITIKYATGLFILFNF